MIHRAADSFRAQTYENRELVILNSGDLLVDGPTLGGIVRTCESGPIGKLRNVANLSAADLGADLIAHFDDDDWSHPERLAIQVAALEASNAEAVGFHDALFWDTREGQFAGAWQYTAQHPNDVIGASLLYRREVWERNPFRPVNVGEDHLWLMKRKVYALPGVTRQRTDDLIPLMVCGVHGANTSTKIEAGKAEWRRAARYDEYCREVMKL